MVKVFRARADALLSGPSRPGLRPLRPLTYPAPCPCCIMRKHCATLTRPQCYYILWFALLLAGGFGIDGGTDDGTGAALLPVGTAGRTAGNTRTAKGTRATDGRSYPSAINLPVCLSLVRSSVRSPVARPSVRLLPARRCGWSWRVIGGGGVCRECWHSVRVCGVRALHRANGGKYIYTSPPPVHSVRQSVPCCFGTVWHSVAQCAGCVLCKLSNGRIFRP